MAEARRLTELAREVGRLATFPAGDMVVALSGGADSAALAWMAVRSGARVRAVHVHHGLAASDLMQRAAEDVATAVGVGLEAREVTVPAGASPEAQARSVRYAALEDALGDAEVLMTAHTADDQAETVLHHLMRGSGPDGLAGIPRRRGRLHRPFLDVTRSHTRELATLAGLPWRDDPANGDAAVLRNQIRHQLLPDLEARFNPRLRRALADTARTVAAEAALLDELTGPEPLSGEAGPEVAASTLTTASPALASRRARLLLAAAGVTSPTATAVTDVLEVAGGHIARADVGTGAVVRRRGAMVVVARERAPEHGITLRISGTTRFGPWAFEVDEVGVRPAAMPLAAHWMVADADAVGTLRVEPASRYPEVNDLLSRVGVPAEDRPSHPVVVGETGPVWVPAVRRLGPGWVAGTTQRYLVARSRVDRSWLRSER